MPLYWGADNVQEWLPNTNSIIDIRQFTPKQLGRLISEILTNDTLYESYLTHKTKGTISNNLLKESLAQRSWGIDNDPDHNNFIDHFECSVCEALHRHKSKPETHVADNRHYGCPMPDTVLPGSDGNTHWREQWHRAKLEARELRRLIDSGKYRTSDYHHHVLKYMMQKKHFQKYPPQQHHEL